MKSLQLKPLKRKEKKKILVQRASKEVTEIRESDHGFSNCCSHIIMTDNKEALTIINNLLFFFFLPAYIYFLLAKEPFVSH